MFSSSARMVIDLSDDIDASQVHREFVDLRNDLSDDDESEIDIVDLSNDLSDDDEPEIDIVDLSNDEIGDSDSDSDKEEGIVDLSNDAAGIDVDVTVWRDDIDHYVEVNGLLLLLEHRVCGALALRKEQQRGRRWLWTLCDESLQEKGGSGQVRWRAGQVLRQRQVHPVFVRRQLSGLRGRSMRGGLCQYAARTKQLHHQPQQAIQETVHTVKCVHILRQRDLCLLRNVIFIISIESQDKKDKTRQRLALSFSLIK